MAPKFTIAHFQNNVSHNIPYKRYLGLAEKPFLEIWQFPLKTDRVYGKVQLPEGPVQRNSAANIPHVLTIGAGFMDAEYNSLTTGSLSQTVRSSVSMSTIESTKTSSTQPTSEYSIKRKPVPTPRQSSGEPLPTAYRALLNKSLSEQISALQDMTTSKEYYSVQAPHSSTDTCEFKLSSESPSITTSDSSISKSNTSMTSQSQGSMTSLSSHTSIPSIIIVSTEGECREIDTKYHGPTTIMAAEEDNDDVDISDYYLSVAAHGDSAWDLKLQYIPLECRDGVCVCLKGCAGLEFA